MAVPLLYWMLECPGCGSRRVVHDYFTAPAGLADDQGHPDDGVDGQPLPRRYRCLRGCAGLLRVIGSIESPEDEEVWLEDPYRPEAMTLKLRMEWSRLMAEAGLGPDRREPEPPPVYWMLECPGCGGRRVVKDFKFKKEPTAGGPVWRPVPGLRPCPEGCPEAPRIAGSIYSLDDEEVYLEYPGTKRKMTREMREEWASLIREMPVTVPKY